MENNEIILNRGNRVLLRDRLQTDVNAFLLAQTNGEWRFTDAPWEGVRSSLSEEEERRFRVQFEENLSRGKEEPRKSAVIALLETGEPIGFVSRYIQHDNWFIGIDIFIDDCLNRGLGSEALSLWVDYLFTHSDIHRLGLDTWSFNPRMVHVAEKLGFVDEGAQRQMQLWQEQWLDLLHFGLLRSEWARRCKSEGQN